MLPVSSSPVWNVQLGGACMTSATVATWHGTQHRLTYAQSLNQLHVARCVKCGKTRACSSPDVRILCCVARGDACATGADEASM